MITAPQTDALTHLLRDRLRESISMTDSKFRRLIVIEAQAGQGKSVFISQYLNQIESPALFYQITPRDRDPIFFIRNFVASLKSEFPEVEIPLLEQMIATGEISGTDIDRYADLISEGMSTALPTDTHVVFDDLHEIEKMPLLDTFFRKLLPQQHPNVVLMLSTRHITADHLKDWIAGRMHILIGNKELAFNKTEVFEYFNSIVHNPLTPESLHRICQTTEGWPMGVVLKASEACRGSNGSKGQDNLPLLLIGPEASTPYFDTEIFSRVSDEIQQGLLRLALVNEIDRKLAACLIGDEMANEILLRLTSQNMFIRPVGNKSDLFTFHHLFRDYLRSKACRIFNKKQLSTLYNRIADYYLNAGLPEQALEYMLKAENYPKAHALIETEGSRLHAENRLVFLFNVLDPLDEDVNRDYPWFSYYYAAACMAVNPARAYDYLSQAKTRFESDGNKTGELIAVSALLYFHLAVDGRYERANAYLPRAERLYRQVADRLSAFYRIQAATNIGLVHYMFTNWIEKMESYCHEALSLAKANQLDDQLAQIQTVMLNKYLGCGIGNGYHAVYEKLYEACFNPKVTEFSRLIILVHAGYIHWLFDGFADLHTLKRMLQRKTRKILAMESIAASFMAIWEIHAALANGAFDKALHLVETAIALPNAARQPHLQSQFLQYQALILAIEGRHKEAVATANLSQQLRLEAGSLVYSMFNHLALGATYIHSGRHRKAIRHLDQCIQISISTNVKNHLLQASAYIYLAFLNLKMKRESMATESTRKAIALMQKHGYETIYLWTPHVMKTVLTYAMSQGIAPDFVNNLSLRKLNIGFTKQGQSIPRLDIRTLGGFRINVQETTIFTPKDFTAKQQLLWSSLIAAPKDGVKVETLCAELWPESTPDKARTSLDTLLSRMRKTVASSGANLNPLHYLVMEKEHLRLSNCWIDAHALVSSARKGLRHAEANERWQAETEFRRVHRMWQGEFLAQFCCSDSAYQYEESRLISLFIETAVKWSEILSDHLDPLKEDLDILMAAIPYAGADTRLAANLYCILSSSGLHGDITRLMESVQKSLALEEYSETEINHLMESVWCKQQ
jgi:ATP/maltotriose-dependent transcriptional regulator MalT/DNA-binding SARP family transcriptional activator